MSRIHDLLRIFEFIKTCAKAYGNEPVGIRFDVECVKEFELDNYIEFIQDYKSLLDQLKQDVGMIPRLTDRNRNMYLSVFERVEGIFSAKRMASSWVDMSNAIFGTDLIARLESMEPMFEPDRSNLQRQSPREAMSQQINDIDKLIDEVDFSVYVRDVLKHHILILRAILVKEKSFKEKEIRQQYESLISKLTAAMFDLPEDQRNKFKTSIMSGVKTVRELIGFGREAKSLADDSGITKFISDAFSS